VQRAYARFPAVVTTGRVGAISFRTTSLLNRGVIVAASFLGTSGSGTTMLVAPPGSPTFARDPGTACWRPARASDGQLLIGERFPPYPKGAVVKAPRRTHNGWLVRVAASGNSFTYAIDGKTLLVPSIAAREGRQHFEERNRTLASAPTLPSPRPRC
jgi:hypothetical protein